MIFKNFVQKTRISESFPYIPLKKMVEILGEKLFLKELTVLFKNVVLQSVV